MKHTEESLMELVWDAIDSIPVCEADEKQWKPLRLAIREVLAERDRLFASLIQMGEWRDKALERAERAEAEVGRLRKDAERLDYIEKHARCDPKMDGHHVWWPTTFKNALRGCNLREAIDAAIEQEYK